MSRRVIERGGVVGKLLDVHYRKMVWDIGKEGRWHMGADGKVGSAMAHKDWIYNMR